MNPSQDAPLCRTDREAPAREGGGTVAALLTASREAHKRKHAFANRLHHKQHVPDYPAAEAAIAEALDLRLQAHALDPDHTDPAWAKDAVPHEELVAFYRRYPEIP